MKTRSAALTGLLLLFLVSGCSGGTSQNSAEEAGRVPEFTLLDIDGRSQSLDGYLGTHRAVLLNFWATWCPPCREEIPDLIKLREKWHAQGFEIVGISVGESAQKVFSFAKKNGITYPVLLDSDSAVTYDYHVVGIPTTFLVGADGKMRGIYHGFTRELERDVENSLK